ncbi:MAG: DeoR/GlpR family DNA-binding transcription regulator [Eubacteriales bacterium]|nr:DeoR/GlpR family DNA-binding transcription regulator [Eubacteriales bacterium]
MKVSAFKRQQEIAEWIKRDGSVKARDLSEIYGVSMETIRKDLTCLEQMGIARKEYGGASVSPLSTEIALDYRTTHLDRKAEIARYALEFLKDQHTLLLDTGTTAMAAVPYINKLPKMDIITNSLDIFEQLDGFTHNVFFPGGRKRERNRSVVGSWTERFLDSIHVDVCFLGTAGIMDSQGPTVHSYPELNTKIKMIERSDLVYVLADSSKFQQNGLHSVADWSRIDGIITDRTLPSSVYQKFSPKVPIYIAKEYET